MKLAVIGNSHLAALKFALREGLFTSSSLEVTFWGVPGKDFRTVTYDGGVFRSPHLQWAQRISDGRYETLPAHDFDAIAFHGPVLPVWKYLSLLSKMKDDQGGYSQATVRDSLRKRMEW